MSARRATGRVLAIAAACAFLPAAVAAPPALDRLGELRVGASFASLDGRGDWVDEGWNPETDCGHYRGGGLPEGLLVMVMDGRIARFEATDGAVAASVPFGLAPGMEAERAVARLPAGVTIEPHAYSAPSGTYVTWRAPDGRTGLRVETYEGRVDQIFWGDAEAITLIEGCS